MTSGVVIADAEFDTKVAAEVVSRARERARLVSKAMIAAVLVASFCNTGCYRTQNIVSMNALETKAPVSASGQYVDEQGQVVTENDYQVLTSFNFERAVEAPRHKKTQQELELEAEIDRIVAQAGGEAVTNFRLEGTEYSSGGHGPAASWKMLGWSFGLTGATLLIVGAAIGDPDINAVFIPMGAAFAGVGLLSFGGAWAARKPATWHFSVGGNVVTRGGGGTVPAARDPASQTPASDGAEEPPDGVTERRTAPAPQRKDDAIEPLSP